MSRKKLQRFTQLNNFDNVVQLKQADASLKLNNFLKNKPDIILELACGKGDYALALAKTHKKSIVIGIDIQGERLWYGAKKAKEEKLKNVLFLRIQIEDLLKYFPKNSISQIWLTFPDPYPKKKKSKKRLTSPRFLKMYKKILKKPGNVHLKTDDSKLLDYSIDSIIKEGGHIENKMLDIYQRKYLPKILKIQTDFEKRHLKNGKRIKYLKFSL